LTPRPPPPPADWPWGDFVGGAEEVRRAPRYVYTIVQMGPDGGRIAPRGGESVESHGEETIPGKKVHRIPTGIFEGWLKVAMKPEPKP